MKPIIVATDFSAAAINAAQYAFNMAQAINGNVLLFHTFQIPVAYSEVPLAANADDMMQDALTEINKQKNDLLYLSDGKTTIDVEVREGVLFYELNELCKKVNPYAVIMGSQGTTAAERIIFGSHTIFAIKHLMHPLITVPLGAKFEHIKKIGLACDFDKVVDTVPVDEIKTLITDFKAEFHILNTGKQESFNPDLIFQSGLFQEMTWNIKPQYHFITHKNIDEGIIDFAEKIDIDLLIVLPKRHNLIEQITHKSHSKQLVLHSHVPVMALHD
ncbi:MAG: universal stress protein [Chitinophagaceae bacterium]|nr:universal stress protein [Chitinophagaceae bacterium]